MLNAKIRSGRKTDHVELIIFAAQEPDNPLNDLDPDNYVHVNKKFPFASPNVDLIRTLSTTDIAPSDTHADLVDALIVALDSMSRYVKKLKYTKEMYIFTDASKQWNTEGTEAIQEEISKLEARMNWIIFPPPEDASRLLVSSNAEYLRDLVEKSLGESYERELAENQLAQLRAKQATSVNARFNLAFGDYDKYPDEALVLKVLMPIKTDAIALPRTSKYSTLSEALDLDERTSKVDVFRNYISTDPNLEDRDDTEKAVSKDDLIKAYRYGKTIVPWNEDDLVDTKYRCSKGLSILGFFPTKLLKRWWIMAGIKAVLPDPLYPRSTQAYSSLYRAMMELETCAVVRHVARDDGNVNVGILIPNPNIDGRKYFMYGKLPFAEDYRVFGFPGLHDLTIPRETSKKRKLDRRVKDSTECLGTMEDLILSMDLMPADGVELVRKKEAFNPGYQRMYQCISHRAVYGPDAPLPAVEPEVLNPISPIPSIMNNSRINAMKVAECFKIEKIVRKGKKKALWGGAEDAVADDGGEAVADALIRGLEESDLVSDLFAQQVERIGSINPVGDYNAMITQPDKKKEALLQILARVDEFVKFGDAYYSKACDCLNAVKNSLGGGEAELCEMFSEYMVGVKTRGPEDFYMFVVADGVWDYVVEDDIVTPMFVQEDKDAEDLLDEL